MHNYTNSDMLFEFSNARGRTRKTCGFCEPVTQ